MWVIPPGVAPAGDIAQVAGACDIGQVAGENGGNVFAFPLLKSQFQTGI